MSLVIKFVRDIEIGDCHISGITYDEPVPDEAVRSHANGLTFDPSKATEEDSSWFLENNALPIPTSVFIPWSGVASMMRYSQISGHVGED
jgi:hypothetical protein